MKTNPILENFKVRLADIRPLTANAIDVIMAEASMCSATVLSDLEWNELWKFAITKHVCTTCGIENMFRAARGSTLCADCFWR